MYGTTTSVPASLDWNRNYPNVLTLSKNFLLWISERAWVRKNIVLSDVQFVLHVSIGLTLARMIITRWLVPRISTPKRLAAMGRCKSSHLLSSQAPADGNTSSSNRAPLYAIAVFRFLFCLGSCMWCWCVFRKTVFWPIWVGGPGTSTTKECWDLSALLEFHESKTEHYLRYFLLVQIAYQLQSVWFHFVYLLVVVCWGDHNQNKSVVRSTFRSYLWPLFGHLIFGSLLFGLYVFSALRRLGTIGIFALELSSCALQLLQVSLYSPVMNKTVVKRVHKYIVVPSFLYCRIFVIPYVVWYSAAFESQDWITQLEKTTIQGSGILIYTFFNSLLGIATLMNLIYLRRLLKHPKLQSLAANS